MRKHSVRKWIHAILDLLPLLVIPIFAINIINRSPEPITVSTTNDVYQNVNFNQLEVLPSVENKVTSAPYGYFASSGNLSGRPLHYIVLKIRITGNINFLHLNLNNGSSNYEGINVNADSNDFYITRFRFSDSDYNKIDYYAFNYSSGQVINYYDNQLFDLTQMFGSGNEPSLQEFLTLFDGDYYNYTLSTPMNIFMGVDTITYNDTDIGSQFVYSLYHVTDKYFNMNDTFNLGQVYEWFSTNIFGGNPPLAVPIVWNVIIYEFIMDLLFLLYAVFMFIIDFGECFMERMFDKARFGGR